MKTALALAIALAATPAWADFDKDFASFDKDFARLSAMGKKKQPPKQVVLAKASGAEQALKLMDRDMVAAPRLREQNEVDPKSSDRLGHQLDNPEMRQKVAALYQKPDIKVYSYVLQAE